MADDRPSDEEMADWLRGRRPNGEANGAIRFPLVAFKDVVFNLDEEWRVEGLLPLIGLAVFYGAPGAVKSFILLDLFLRMARGGLWGGRKVEQSTVIYIAAEGSGGVNKRLSAMRKALVEKGLSPNVPFYLIQVTPNLGTGENDCKKLIEDIETQLPGINPGAIAVDTTSQALGGADENTKGMAQLVANATAIFNRFKCLVALIHHTPLSDEERLRGGTPLIGGVDVSILSKYTKGSLVAALTVMKMRDDDAEQSFTVHLSRLVLGQTKTGREVSTLVVEFVETGAAEGAKPRKKLPDLAANALSALRYAIDEVGAIPPASNHIPKMGMGTKCVSPKQWREYANMTSTLPEGDTRDKNFERGCERLKAEKIIGKWGSYVWLA